MTRVLATRLLTVVLAVAGAGMVAASAARPSVAVAGARPSVAGPVLAQAPTAGAQQPTAGSSSAAPASSSDVELSDRAYAIARKLRCPVCTAESVADSNAEISAEMRNLIQQQLNAGKSETQIISYFKQRYGDWILLDPPKQGFRLLVWLVPALALIAGIVGLAMLMRRWRAAAEETPQVDPEARARVRQALAAHADGGPAEGRGSHEGERRA